MKIYLGVTDNNWFKYLRGINPEDVNFWQPGGSIGFKALSPGGPFLFKLKSPINAIGGLGFFSSHSFLPLSIAWQTFQERNGCNSLFQLRSMITNYRKDALENPTIGCIILTNPIFFKESDWIEVPPDWSKSIVQGKAYDTQSAEGKILWNKVEALLHQYLSIDLRDQGKSQLLLEEQVSPAYSQSILTKVRLGQGAFRTLVIDAYNRRCSITGERTLPVLEAAHIMPYARSGPHFISNGLLVRSDFHTLLDNGYVTITKDLKVEVSNRIKQEFDNGKEYYQYHGKPLTNLPTRAADVPNEKYLEWHNENIFRA